MSNQMLDDEPEDMNAWLDSELRKITMDKSDIIRELGDTGKIDFEDFKLDQLSPELYPMDSNKSESYNNFLSSFEGLKTEQKEKTSGNEIYEDVNKDSPIYHMYKEQLQAALSKQNLTMDDYLNARITFPREDSIIDEEDKHEPSFFSEINIEDYNLKSDEIKEVTEIAEKKYISSLSVPNALGLEMEKLASLPTAVNLKDRASLQELIHEIHVDAEAIRQIPKWQKDLERRIKEANDQREALELKEKERRVRVKVEIGDLEAQVKLRVAELTASIEAEKKNLEKLKKMAAEDIAQNEESDNKPFSANNTQNLLKDNFEPQVKENLSITSQKCRSQRLLQSSQINSNTKKTEVDDMNNFEFSGNEYKVPEFNRVQVLSSNKPKIQPQPTTYYMMPTTSATSGLSLNVKPLPCEVTVCIDTIESLVEFNYTHPNSELSIPTLGFEKESNDPKQSISEDVELENVNENTTEQSSQVIEVEGINGIDFSANNSRNLKLGRIEGNDDGDDNNNDNMFARIESPDALIALTHYNNETYSISKVLDANDKTVDDTSFSFSTDDQQKESTTNASTETSDIYLSTPPPLDSPRNTGVLSVPSSQELFVAVLDAKEDFLQVADGDKPEDITPTNQRVLQMELEEFAGKGGFTKVESIEPTDTILSELYNNWLHWNADLLGKSPLTSPSEDRKKPRFHFQKTSLREFPLELLKAAIAHGKDLRFDTEKDERPLTPYLILALELSNIPLNKNFAALCTSCPHLSVLKLENCGLNSAAAASIVRCPNLRVLDLSQNEIEILDLDDITRGVLRVLDISINRLEKLENLKGPFDNLIHLNLSSNKLMSFDPSEIHDIAPLLVNVTCANNFINGLGSKNNKCPSNPLMCAINLSGNQIGDINNLLTPNTTPIWLNLSENSLFELPYRGIHGPLLHELLLDRNNLSSLEPLANSWLPNLCFLSANENRITEFPMLYLPRLSAIYLHKNRLSDLDAFIIAASSGLPLLQTLDISENPLALRRETQAKLLHGLPSLILIECSSTRSNKDLPVMHPSRGSLPHTHKSCFMTAFYSPITETIDKDQFLLICNRFIQSFRRRITSVKKYFGLLCPEQALPLIKTTNIGASSRLSLGFSPDISFASDVQLERFNSPDISFIASLPKIECFVNSSAQFSVNFRRFTRSVDELRILLLKHLHFQLQEPQKTLFMNETPRLDICLNSDRKPHMSAAVISARSDKDFHPEQNCNTEVNSHFSELQLTQSSGDQFLTDEQTVDANTAASKIQAYWRGYQIRKWTGDLLKMLQIDKSWNDHLRPHAVSVIKSEFSNEENVSISSARTQNKSVVNCKAISEKSSILTSIESDNDLEILSINSRSEYMIQDDGQSARNSKISDIKADWGFKDDRTVKQLLKQSKHLKLGSANRKGQTPSPLRRKQAFINRTSLASSRSLKSQDLTPNTGALTKKSRLQLWLSQCSLTVDESSLLASPSIKAVSNQFPPNPKKRMGAERRQTLPVCLPQLPSRPNVKLSKTTLNLIDSSQASTQVFKSPTFLDGLPPTNNLRFLKNQPKK